MALVRYPLSDQPCLEGARDACPMYDDAPKMSTAGVGMCFITSPRKISFSLLIYSEYVEVHSEIVVISGFGSPLLRFFVFISTWYFPKVVQQTDGSRLHFVNRLSRSHIALEKNEKPLIYFKYEFPNKIREKMRQTSISSSTDWQF